MSHGRGPKVYLVSYDISQSPERLRLVYRAMRGFGEHIQFSVFRCVLSDLQLARMKDRLLDILDQEKDQVLIFPLGHASSSRAWEAEALGRPLEDMDRTVNVVG